MLKTFQFLDATAALVALLLSQAQAQDDSELAKKNSEPGGGSDQRAAAEQLQLRRAHGNAPSP
jgi:hypothetical protein